MQFNYDDEEWEMIITEFMKSGLSINTFCRRNEIPRGIFNYHLQKDPRYQGLEDRRESEYVSESENNSELPFLPVTVVPDVMDEITVNGYRIRIDQSTSTESLRILLNAMRDL